MLNDFEKTMIDANRWHMIACVAAFFAIAAFAIVSFNGLMTMERQYQLDARI